MGYGSDTFGDNDPATWPYTWALVGNGGLVTAVGDLERWLTALFGSGVVSADTLSRLRDVHFAEGAETIAGQVVYGAAGAGDFGLGGVVVFAPASETRVIVATNAYDAFDIESFGVDLAVMLLEGDS